MHKTIKACISTVEDGFYVAECLEVNVVTQGKTINETVANLQEAVALYFAEEDSIGYEITVSIVLREDIAMRQVVVYPGEDGWWVAECPSLPGCISQGETRESAIRNIKDAIHEYVQALVDDSLPVPEENFSVLVVAV